MARRVVAAVLFGPSAEQSPPARVASTTAWLWAAWAAAIAVSYFAFAAWWTIELY